MIKPSLTLALLATLITPVFAEGDGEKKPVVARKPPSHADIAKIQQTQAKARDHIHKKAPQPLVTIKKHSLIGSSALLGHSGYWTLVPRGSVIHIPTRHLGKVLAKPKGKLLSWKQFLRENYGWLHVHEISMSQAKGRKKINPKSIEAYKSIGKIVVATCSKGPISVAPDSLKPPVANEDKGAKKTEDEE